MKGYIAFTYSEIEQLGEYGLRRKVRIMEKHSAKGFIVYKSPARCIENTEIYYKNFFAEVEVANNEIRFLKIFNSIDMLFLCLNSKPNSNISDFSVKVRLFAVENQFHIDNLLSDPNKEVKLNLIRKGWYVPFLNDVDPDVALKAKLYLK